MFDGFASLASNAGLLLSLVVLYDALGLRRDGEWRLARQTLTGLLIGLIAAALMAISWHLVPGIVFDTRSVALALAGLFFGLVPAAVAVVVAAAVRLAIGGAGEWMGVAVIGLSAGIGVAWRELVRRRDERVSLTELYVFGLVVHLVMLACTALLPAGTRLSSLVAIAAPVMVIYPVATALVGWVLMSWHDRRAAASAALELAATRERLEAIVEAAPVAVVALDLEGRVSEWSPAAEAMFGWPRGEVLGRPNPIVPAAGRADHLQFTRSALGGEPIRGLEVDRVRRDGSTIRVRLSNAVVRDGSGAPGGVMAVLEDVTERANLEAQLRQAQKMEAVGRLAGGIAHDFNNLLQALLASTQALRLKGAAPEVDAYLSEVEVQVERGVGLSRQLLLFSRQAPSRWEQVDLGAVVADHLRMLRRLLPESVGLSVDLPQEMVAVTADAGQLGQVLTNLVVNARDAMPGGGKLDIRVVARGEEAVLEVADDGVGVPVELRERLFDPFFTTKAHGEGSGLGLAVVWGIVDEHGGRIEFESEAGGGTLFRVVLPRADGDRQLGGDPGDQPSPRVGRGERILLVEDESATREGLQQLLAELGFEVVAVASGEEASALPADDRFDLLLTDYLLPGVDGLELARRLAVRRPGLKVVVMSGYAPGFIGEATYLQKPFGMLALAQVLRARLDES